jgi:adenine-specific DNA glycosylase
MLQQILLGPLAGERVGEVPLRVTGWRMLVGCIMLNQTSRRQVDRVWPEFFRLFPSAETIVYSGANGVGSAYNLLSPLGLVSRRHQHVLAMSSAWTQRTLGWSVRDLPGCGQYASDSWEIFVNNDRTIQPQDKELRAYLGLPPLEVAS